MPLYEYQCENCEHRFEPPQDAVGPPIFRKLDGGTHQITLVFVELGVEPLEQRECIGRRAGKPRQNAIVIKPTYFFRALLDHDIAECDLAVATHRDLGAATRGNNVSCGASGIASTRSDSASSASSEAQPPATMRRHPMDAAARTTD